MISNSLDDSKSSAANDKVFNEKSPLIISSFLSSTTKNNNSNDTNTMKMSQDQTKGTTNSSSRSSMKYCCHAIINFVEDPLMWLLVNVFCLIWSIMLLLFLFFKETRAHHFARDNYFVYNLTTCIIWVIEATVNVHREQREVSMLLLQQQQEQDSNNGISSREQKEEGTNMQQQREQQNTPNEGNRLRRISRALSEHVIQRAQNNAHKIEFALAVYFVLDAIHMMIKKHHGKDHTKGIAFDIVMGIIAYTYESHVQYKYYQTHDGQPSNIEFDEQRDQTYTSIV